MRGTVLRGLHQSAFCITLYTPTYHSHHWGIFGRSGASQMNNSILLRADLLSPLMGSPSEHSLTRITRCFFFCFFFYSAT